MIAAQSIGEPGTQLTMGTAQIERVSDNFTNKRKATS